MQTTKMAPAPQGPWSNPVLPEGLYDAEITSVGEGTYGEDKEMYLQFMFWLPKPEVYFVTNLYFPKGRDSKSVQRLGSLCRCLNLVPQDAIDSPRSFQGLEMRITVREMKATSRTGGKPYCDVDLFLPPEI